MTDQPTEVTIPERQSPLQRITIRLAPPGTHYEEDLPNDWLCEVRVDGKVWHSGWGNTEFAAASDILRMMVYSEVLEWEKKVKDAKEVVERAES